MLLAREVRVLVFLLFLVVSGLSAGKDQAKLNYFLVAHQIALSPLPFN
jgi:hypothetical protein